MLCGPSSAGPRLKLAEVDVIPAEAFQAEDAKLHLILQGVKLGLLIVLIININRYYLIGCVVIKNRQDKRVKRVWIERHRKL